MMLPSDYDTALFVHGLFAFLFGAVAGVVLRLLSGPCKYTTDIGRLFEKFHLLQQIYHPLFQVFLKLIFLIVCILIPAVLFFHLSEYLSLPRNKWPGLIYLFTLGIVWLVSERF
ncbi:MAG: hypothetical protein DID92_2727743288 [Candidatus Nitrotoga sp. SPKER]|nr:MAG: hypothetical protein DID92_2727743288 [Candidatus Nitrotoga sp. SPKER]